MSKNYSRERLFSKSRSIQLMVASMALYVRCGIAELSSNNESFAVKGFDKCSTLCYKEPDGSAEKYVKEIHKLKFSDSGLIKPIMVQDVQFPYIWVRPAEFPEDIYYFPSAPFPSRMQAIDCHTGKPSNIFHSCLVQDKPVLSAGEFWFEPDNSVTIIGKSGHYKPSQDSVQNAAGLFKEKTGKEVNVKDFAFTEENFFKVLLYDRAKAFAADKQIPEIGPITKNFVEENYDGVLPDTVEHERPERWEEEEEESWEADEEAPEESPESLEEAKKPFVFPVNNIDQLKVNNKFFIQTQKDFDFDLFRKPVTLTKIDGRLAGFGEEGISIFFNGEKFWEMATGSDVLVFAASDPSTTGGKKTKGRRTKRRIIKRKKSRKSCNPRRPSKQLRKYKK